MNASVMDVIGHVCPQRLCRIFFFQKKSETDGELFYRPSIDVSFVGAGRMLLGHRGKNLHILWTDTIMVMVMVDSFVAVVFFCDRGG